MSFLLKLKKQQAQIVAGINNFIDNFKAVSYKAYAKVIEDHSTDRECLLPEEKFQDTVNRFIKEFKSKAQINGDKLKIWRVLNFLKDISEVDLKQIGFCWTWNEKKVPYLKKHLDSDVPKKNQYIVVGYIDSKGIEYDSTLAMTSWLPEDELRIKQNATIYITEIYNAANKKIGKKFNPPKAIKAK